MQAEVAVRLDSGSLDDNAIKVSNDSASLVNAETADKKVKEKKPLKIDFSAFCDCV